MSIFPQQFNRLIDAVSHSWGSLHFMVLDDVSKPHFPGFIFFVFLCVPGASDVWVVLWRFSKGLMVEPSQIIH